MGVSACGHGGAVPHLDSACRVPTVQALYRGLLALYDGRVRDAYGGAIAVGQYGGMYRCGRERRAATGRGSHQYRECRAQADKKTRV